MNREIQSKVIVISTISDDTEELDNLIWSESQPYGISNEVDKNRITIYYPVDKFPNQKFIEKLKSYPQVKSISEKVIYKKDWTKKWQRFFKPIRIADDFVIIPPFKKHLKAYCKEKRVIINPSMAFGTGHHESTQGILKLLYKYQGEIKSKRVADFGSGSGILSIFARMLGSGSIDAYDFDPECKKAIEENIRLNNIDGINFFNRPIKYVRKKYDVILANMLFNEIASNRNVFFRSVKKCSMIFIGGIMDCERESFLKLFKKFKLIDELILNDWRSFLFINL